jgi:hypothetical protein
MRESILAFSCKTRLLCPSCAARHTGDGAAHFLDRVLPDLPYRQVVVSLPYEVRGLLAFRPKVASAAVRLIDDTVMGWQRRRAGGRVGGVSVLQRSGGSLNVHPHVHMLVADGAWHEQRNGTLRFEATPAPTLDEVAALAERIGHRLTKMLHRRGLTLRAGEDPPPPEAPDPLAGCIQVALGLGHRERTEPSLPLASDEPPRLRPRDPPLCAIAQGVNVHAGVVVPAGDRAALERLVRYLLRSPLSLQRLSLRDDGGPCPPSNHWGDVVVYRLQRPDRRGRTALVMTPLELLARLAAILPAPRLALRRQLGVFSPGSPDRRKIMPAPAPSQSCHPSARSAPTRVPWAELLRRVWHIEALRCEHCGGRLRPVAVVQDLAEAERYLRARGEFTPVPGPARSRGPPAAAA